MFCPKCGAEVSQNYCSACGTLATTVKNTLLQEEINFHKIISDPEVRGMLSFYSDQHVKKKSASEFLKSVDIAGLPITGTSLNMVSKVAVPISIKLGIKTGKTSSLEVQQPIGKVIIATLASMAWRGQTMLGATQARDGCVIEGRIPSDMFSWEGNLMVSICQKEDHTLVEAGTIIKGQMYDWGKSKRLLKQLLEDVSKISAQLP